MTLNTACMWPLISVVCVHCHHIQGGRNKKRSALQWHKTKDEPEAKKIIEETAPEVKMHLLQFTVHHYSERRKTKDTKLLLFTLLHLLCRHAQLAKTGEQLAQDFNDSQIQSLSIA